MQVATETPQIMIFAYRGATQEQSSMDKGVPVAPYFPQWIRTGAVGFALCWLIWHFIGYDPDD